MYNAYFAANGAIMTRNTTTGMGYIVMDAGGIAFNGYTGAVTANTVQAGINQFLKMNGSIGAQFSGIITAPGITSTSTVAVNAATGITTNQSTFPLVNTAATTINMGGAATTINLGSATIGGAGSNVFVGNAIGTSSGNLTVRAFGTYNSVNS
jgi:hypothetical protein